MAIGDPNASAPDLVLAALIQHPGSTVKQIARFALVGESTATKALAAMEKAGLTVREEHPPAGPSNTRGKPAATWEATEAGHAPKQAPEQPVREASPLPTRDLLTVAEVADFYRVSRMTIYRMVRGGEMPHLRVGKAIRIPRAEVERAIPQADDHTRVEAAINQRDP